MPLWVRRVQAVTYVRKGRSGAMRQSEDPDNSSYSAKDPQLSPDRTTLFWPYLADLPRFSLAAVLGEC